MFCFLRALFSSLNISIFLFFKVSSSRQTDNRAQHKTCLITNGKMGPIFHSIFSQHSFLFLHAWHGVPYCQQPPAGKKIPAVGMRTHPDRFPACTHMLVYTHTYAHRPGAFLRFCSRAGMKQAWGKQCSHCSFLNPSTGQPCLLPSH